MLGLSSTQIGDLITYVSGQMSAAGIGAIDGSGSGAGFKTNLGDISGDGTGSGAGSGLPNATHTGNVVMVQQPAVTLVAADMSTPTQYRHELFTTNAAGQPTTHTDPEGNLTVYVRYPFNDPEGNGGAIDPSLGTFGGKQYGRMKEIHVDANPDDVLSLVGADGDLIDFIPAKNHAHEHAGRVSGPGHAV